MLWWLTFVQEWNCAPVVVRTPDLQMIMDASHLGWRATLSPLEASNQCNRHLSCKSSNFREIMAILLAMMTFRERIRGKCLQILTDNTTALAYVTNQGSMVPELTRVARAIWKLSLDLDIHI